MIFSRLVCQLVCRIFAIANKSNKGKEGIGMAQGATFEHDVWSRARIHQDMLNEPGASMDVRYTLTRGLFFQEIFRFIPVHVSVPGPEN